MNDTKVKPCPFCGGKSRVHQYLGKWYARCNKCKSYSAPYDTEEQAQEAWNRRSKIDDTSEHETKVECRKASNELNHINFENLEEATEI